MTALSRLLTLFGWWTAASLTTAALWAAWVLYRHHRKDHRP